MLVALTFSAFLDGFQKQLGTLVGGAIWLGLSLAAKFSYDLFQNWRIKRQKAKQSHPLYLADKQIQLDIAADRACLWAGACHVSIYQFSNGQHFSNGDSIQKVSMVGEAVENNALRRWRMESQNLPTSAFPYMLRALEKGHVWLYQDECEDYQLNVYLRERGYTCRVVTLLTGAKGSWLGLLIISWNEGRFTDDLLDLAKLEQHRRAAAAILAQP